MVISNEKKIGNEERFTFYFNVQKIIPKQNFFLKTKQRQKPLKTLTSKELGMRQTHSVEIWPKMDVIVGFEVGDIHTQNKDLGVPWQPSS